MYGRDVSIWKGRFHMHLTILSISSPTEGEPNLWELYGEDSDNCIFDGLGPEIRSGFLSKESGEYLYHIPVKDIDLDSPKRFKEAHRLCVLQGQDEDDVLAGRKVYWDLNAFVGCDGKWVDYSEDIEDWDAFIDGKLRDAPDDAIAIVYDCHC